MSHHRKYDISYAKSITDIGEGEINFGKKNGLIDGSYDGAEYDSERSDLYKKKWMLVALSWSIEKFCSDPKSLFEEVDYIVADFEYPRYALDILSFIPAETGESSTESHFARIKDFVEKLKDDVKKTQIN